MPGAGSNVLRSTGVGLDRTAAGRRMPRAGVDTLTNYQDRDR